MNRRYFTGEFIGTFLLVFLGCSTVASAVLLSSFNSLYQVAALWGAAVTVAIYASVHLSGAHLNPAITLCLACFTDFSWRKAPLYIAAQCLGAFAAGGLLFILFEPSITLFEQAEGIVRGEIGSERSAMILAEFYPNPAGAPHTQGFTLKHAIMAEGLGTAILAFVICSLSTQPSSRMPSWLPPLIIGITLTVLISIIAPISQAGFNPARDLMPRLVLSLTGWGAYPFSCLGAGWLLVYVIAPIIGAITGGYLHKLTSPHLSTT